MKHREVTLDDKYALEQGQAFMTGIQALVRLPLDQARRDRAAGLRTGGFISGYRGSPLGGYDQQLKRGQKLLDTYDIKLWEGLNEDLGATAVWGSQQVHCFDGATHDGVFGIWYGKAPGVDRTGDVFKHANFAGSAPLGGVLAIAGDDHACKSSTLPSQSEFAFQDAEIPVLNPPAVQDVLDYGLYGWAMSRFSGLWVGMIALADTMDSGAVVDVSRDRFGITLPAFDFPADGVHLRRGDTPMLKEARLRQIKLPAAQAFVRANGLDRPSLVSPRPRIGIVTTGQAARDVFEALAALGLSPAEAADLGLTIFNVAMPWPLEPTAIGAWCKGLERVLVFEHKRDLIESQLKAALYRLPDSQRPLIEGKVDGEGRPLLPSTSSIPMPAIARAVFERLPQGPHTARAEAYFERIGLSKAGADANAADIARKPHYCSGCPHNTSTVVPEGSRALAGIGCHYMATMMDRADMTSQMGGEGVSWIGQSPFTTEPHVFVNLGDGTYSHSGSLAIRASVSAGTTITYKLLYNDAVAMTGGQQVESGQTVPQITRQLRAEGVSTVVVVADDTAKYAHVTDLAHGVRVYPRAELEAVQLKLREVPGVSVLIYDQVCATEKRRRQKRGLMPASTKRAFINSAVCEGCGDCSTKSNCLSIEPLETEFGRKRMVNQESCNQDLRCVDGFCPSFVTIIDGHDVRRDRPRRQFTTEHLSLPEEPAIDAPWNILFTGVGGTGVTTVAAILGMAAHVDGVASTTLDMTGLAQKGGPVLSHVRIAKRPADLTAARVAPASAHAVIACDLVVAASAEALLLSDPTRTQVAASMDVRPTSEFITNRAKRFEAEVLAGRVKRQSAAFSACHAEALAEEHFQDAIYSNMIMLGYAWQMGLVPVSLRALYRAIKLNGVAVADNQRAFDIGRIALAEPETLADAPAPRVEPKAPDLDAFIARREGFLTQYQDAAYAARYRALVDAVRAREAALGLGETLTRAVATYAHKLMAYKDEYEVARLYTTGEFEKTVRGVFGGKFKMNFHLAPPLLSPKDAKGHLKKSTFGPWMFTVFKVLKRMKGLRGTAFDPVGWTEERKMERLLRDEYLTRIEGMLADLSRANHALAVEIASLPDQIRGFGHVKEASVVKVEARLAELNARWPEGAPTRATLIAV
jgi:indolepyruvate ferredoxin oxidoreductase